MSEPADALLRAIGRSDYHRPALPQPEPPPPLPPKPKKKTDKAGYEKVTLRLDESLMEPCWEICETSGITREVFIEALIVRFNQQSPSAQAKVLAIAQERLSQRVAEVNRKRAAQKRK